MPDFSNNIWKSDKAIPIPKKISKQKTYLGDIKSIDNVFKYKNIPAILFAKVIIDKYNIFDELAKKL